MLKLEKVIKKLKVKNFDKVDSSNYMKIMFALDTNYYSTDIESIIDLEYDKDFKILYFNLPDKTCYICPCGYKEFLNLKKQLEKNA